MTLSQQLDWTDIDDKAVDTARVLAMDAVQKVGNGHPGTAMSLAPVAYLLFQKVMRHDPADPEWIARDHFLGRGEFEPENVSHRNGKLHLTLPAHTYNGGEIQSASRVRFRDIEVRLRTPDAPGTISTFFLYQLVPGIENDEIDIEIFNDGSRQIWFTTWVAGVETNHEEYTLPFDPAARFHDYRIEWSRRRVRFLVDGVPMQEFTKRVPRKAMYVFSSAWWPSWLPEPAPAPPAPTTEQ